MSIRYFKRYRMELDFGQARLGAPTLPRGYSWMEWEPEVLAHHASAKYLSFRHEIDAHVFPCLGDHYGCLRLMEEISGQRRFLPDATWLIVHRPSRDAEPVDCGTIQGLASSQTLGAIQNVGIVPEHRGRGLGRALVLKSLYGFRASGLSRVTLEVTATNVPAVELYKSIGFQVMRTTYRAVQPDESHAG